MAVQTVVLGAGGRMGRALVRGLLSHPELDLKLAGAVDLWDSPALGQDAGLAAGAGEAGVKITADLAPLGPKADVIIDFTSHHGTVGNGPRCADWKTALVIGTTGLSESERKEIDKSAGVIPVVMAPNMSLGVNVLLALVRQASVALKAKGYDIEIIERHHRHKKDAPSGTALALGQAAAEGMGWTLSDVRADGRTGLAGERPERQIGFHAVRGGDFVGDHTVLFAGEGECIELSHRATSRDTFAMGALRAAAWVVGQGPGLYTMRDVLGI